MSNVVLDRVSKDFSGGPATESGTLAVDDISLQIEDREFLVLVGPSGCGKSTTLRLIAGLETCTAGEVRIGDRIVDNVQTVVAPKDRDIAMVFQNYALYPHMSVYKNLSFGLTLRYGGGIVARGLRRIFQPKRAAELAALRGGIDVQVRQTVERLGIEKLLDRKPHQLSGGERQRVALGRAIVRKPAAFLFDEPLSNLDAKLRQQMRVELKRLHSELDTTMIYVTHDQVEAMTLGDRVAVMNKGKILQVGRPLDVYQHPASLFVARFIGNVPMNLRKAKVDRKSNQIVFNGESFQFRFNSDDQQVLDAIAKEGQSRRVVIGFRCEDVRAEPFQGSVDDFVKAMGSSSVGDAGVPNALGQVVAVDHLGDSTLIHLDHVGLDEDLKHDGWTADLIVVRVPARTECQVGDIMAVTVDPQKVLWFDADSGENLLKEKT